LGLRTVGALDVERNQCSGFIYAISVADQYIKAECIKHFGSGSRSAFNQLGLLTTRGRGFL